jgi:hypothetical protein
MSWRSVIALLLLAFVGGGAAFAWLSSDGRMPWDAEKAPIAAALEDMEASVAANAVALPAPTIIQPSATQAEAALLVLSARRLLEAGKPLGEVGNRLQVTFGQVQPRALAAIMSAARQPVSNAILLDGFDAIMPKLLQPNGTAWDRGQYELAHLFVIRRGDAPPTAMAMRIQRTREQIIAGDIESAVKTVRALPGAENAREWLVEADRAITARRALDVLAQGALAPPPVPIAPVEPAPSLAPVVTTQPAPAAE